LTDTLTLYGWSHPEVAWRERAKCVGMGDVMFPNGKPELTRQAVSICQSCPVVSECGRFAEEVREKSGVWGGRSRGNGRLGAGPL
jgi:WhiB family redox-sensing transcriptional regulator